MCQGTIDSIMAHISRVHTQYIHACDLLDKLRPWPSAGNGKKATHWVESKGPKERGDKRGNDARS